MDYMRLDTSGVLSDGILNRPVPKTSCPEGFSGERVDEYEWSEESLLDWLEKSGLEASMYYGCWNIWKTEKGYSGELRQYRTITEAFTDQDTAYALDKAQEWASGCQG
jgi:hypothetical protein